MKKIAISSCLFFLFTTASFFPQSRLDSLTRAEEIPIFYRHFNFSNQLSNGFLPNELNNLKINSKFLNDTSSLWLKTRLQLNEMIYQEIFSGNLQSNILNPLSQQYSVSQNMKLFKSILGAVSVGTVGYLAYQHIKKYGFLKRR